MNTRPLLVVIGVVVIVILLYLAFSMFNSESMPDHQAATSTVPVATTTTAATTTAGAAATAPARTPATPDTGTAASKNVTVTYGSNGFSPASVTVPVGGTVTWVNQGTDRMWVGSSRHPDHTVYDGTSTSQHCSGGTATSAAVFDQCSAGTRYTFTFTKAGTWYYHNHANAGHFGSVTVTQ
jgi:plastocyanin